MNFNLTEDQEQLRDAIRKWVDRSYTFSRRRAIVSEGGFSRKAYSELAELGLCGLNIPEHLGGLGMGPVESMVVMEELGRGMVLEPFAHAIIVSTLFTTYADSSLQNQWCHKIANGTALVVLAHVERDARYQLDICTAKASQVGEQWVLNGAKSLVPAGDQADAFIVPALVQGKMALYVTKRKAPGVSVRGYITQDGSRAAEVTFDHADAELLTTEGRIALDCAADTGIAALCAEAVGVMDQALAVTVDYLKTRKQFGVEIGNFQALRHRIADMKMALELARSMSYYATLKLNASAEDRRRAVSSAKYQLGTSMRFIGQQAVQLHGGIGLTDEYVVSHFFKKLTQLEMTFGDSLHHLTEVSARMQTTAGVI